MARTIAFWTALVLMPLAVVTLLTYLPNDTFDDVPYYASWAMLAVLALAPGLVLIFRRPASTTFKWWCSIIYVIAYAPIMPIVLIMVACTLHPCEL